MSNLAQDCKQQLKVGGKSFDIWSLAALDQKGHGIKKLPFSIRILLENALRNRDGLGVTDEHIDTLLNWEPIPKQEEVPYKPARVLMQDFTGVPAIVDLASVRQEASRHGVDAKKINPLIPVDLVIDHSVQVDYFGSKDSLEQNINMEYERNRERYQFLKWAQTAFNNFTVVPPGMGICHQVNLEYLAQGIVERDGALFPDTLVGTDSHTPMVNGIGVVAWGVGGIEAEAAILGQPIYFIMPEVVGLKLTGNLPLGTTATDLVLTITELLRKHGVVGKFVEVFGDGLDNLTVTDRATISNMSPEFGCTVTYFPIDDRTLDYMRDTNRDEAVINRVETYCKNNMLWRADEDQIRYSSVVELDLSSVVPTVSGPKRPQDKIEVTNLKAQFKSLMELNYGRKYQLLEDRSKADNDKGFIKTVEVQGEDFQLHDGSIAIAAITSCTNTSNPSVMLGAGLVAKKANDMGLKVKPWVKTSLAPGSKVVTDYLEHSGLLDDLEALNFFLVGYGCTSCIGNSGPLPDAIGKAVKENDMVVASVLSGNRNFEARVHPDVKMNFLMSPMLVVMYALAGRVDIDFDSEPVTYTVDDKPVYFKDLWPSNEEIQQVMSEVLSPADYAKSYGEIFEGNEQWKNLEVSKDKVYQWDDQSTYIKQAPFFKGLKPEIDVPGNIEGARVLLKLGDSITTDHISPAGGFSEKSPAGQYLLDKGVEKRLFNSYGSRRGNDEVMVRGTFANVRIKNQLVDKEGGYTRYIPNGETMTVFDAAMKYQEDNTPLVVLAGKEYGSGSSRDWAAKGTTLLGIKAVIAESYERIHRSNLVGMGVLPLQFKPGEDAETLGLRGDETFNILGLDKGIETGQTVQVEAVANDESGKVIKFEAISRLDSRVELEYYKNGGILHYVLRQFINQA
ncbi:aconitate hydratase AcnA [Kangiella profundi]|uniref:Aconitate hydratase n=1 Tax=Kangiella profundi TaxID=1561924 RepID=A0A2K9A6Z4_9GAMM|nr:aconitate hydratase AcnA [Kangiella profundi]AUD79605.1 aconitate hydratase AcnA [Kangiella profundi]GGE97013.1 aconitate hydratase A [Kangiella profundi]